MGHQDVELTRRVRDIIAVAADDIDAVMADVEDGVVYIEGVVSGDEQRRTICNAVRHLDGVNHVVECLATEHVLPTSAAQHKDLLYPTQVLMHDHYLS